MVEVCSYHGPYPGTFIPTLTAVGHSVRQRLELDYHCVFPAVTRDRAWVHTLREAGIEPTFLASSTRAGALRTLAHLARSRNAALVRSHFSRWDLEAGAAARLARAASVWHIHSGRFARQATGATRARDLVKTRVFGRLCDRVLTVSDELHCGAVARGFPEWKVETLPNGIDIDRFERLRPREEARAALGLESASTVVLGFAWSPHAKGTDVLVDGARALGDARALVLVLVGDPATLAPIVGSTLPPWVRVVAPRDDVETLYAATDVFVSASREEGFPYAIGEAMASGLPAVSSDIPGPAAYFAAAGVETFPSEDAVRLEAALRELVRSEDRERLGTANREFIRARLSLATHVDHVVAVFERLLSGSSSAR